MKICQMTIFFLMIIGLSLSVKEKIQRSSSTACCSGSCLRKCMRETGSMSKCLKPCRGISGNTKIKARNYIKELKRSPRSRFSIRRSRSRRGRIFRSRFRRPIKFSRNRSIRRRFGKLRTKSIKRFTKKVTRSKSTKSKRCIII